MIAVKSSVSAALSWGLEIASSTLTETVFDIKPREKLINPLRTEMSHTRNMLPPERALLHLQGVGSVQNCQGFGSYLVPIVKYFRPEAVKEFHSKARTSIIVTHRTCHMPRNSGRHVGS